MTRLRLVSIDGISVPPEPIKAPDTRPCLYCGIGFGVPGMLAGVALVLIAFAVGVAAQGGMR